MTNTLSYIGGKDDEWYTPPGVIEQARTVMGGIDCDPASNADANQIIKATTTFTIANSGLRPSAQWIGSVWLNPPYSLNKQFAMKLLGEVTAGRTTTALVLVNNCTECRWFQSLLSTSSAICLLRGRLSFWRPGVVELRKTTRGQTIFYIGDDVETFAHVFGSPDLRSGEKAYGQILGHRSNVGAASCISSLTPRQPSPTAVRSPWAIA